MKHRSVNKVRSIKTSKAKRFVANQLANKKYKSNHPYKQIWVSKVFIDEHKDQVTQITIPAAIRIVQGTYNSKLHGKFNRKGELLDISK